MVRLFVVAFVPGTHFCFCSLTLFSSAAYLENEGLSGARKRSAEDDNNNEDGITLGSQNTNSSVSSSDSEMSSNAKKNSKAGTPGKGAAAAGGSPAPKPVKEKLSDLEMLAHRMDKMVLKAETYGFNFNCAHPHYWWTYSVSGVSYIKAEFLTWTVHQDEITCKISQDGLFLYVGTKVPDRFVNIFRQRGYYADQAQVPEEGDVMLEEGRKTVSAIQQLHSMEQIKPLTKVKLPFTVQEDFHDPYHPLEKGYGLRSYPHENALQPAPAAAGMGPHPAPQPQLFFVIHVSMQSKARAHQKTRMEYEHVPMNAGDFGEV
jgi:hypothetical protein